MTFTLTILTPESKAYSGEVEALVAPGLEGSFGVLPRHAPMVCALRAGIVKLQVDGAASFFVIRGGVAEVGPDAVTILTDGATPAQDPLDAEAKLEKAEEEERSG